MRAAAHALIAAGGAATLTAAIKARNPDARLPHPAFAAVVAALASKLPDVLEPADHPHHRQFFHSLAFASAAGLAWKHVYGWVPETPAENFLRDVLLSVGLGYFFHLGADFTTAKGLPLLGTLNIGRPLC